MKSTLKFFKKDKYKFIFIGSLLTIIIQLILGFVFYSNLPIYKKANVIYRISLLLKNYNIESQDFYQNYLYSIPDVG